MTETLQRPSREETTPPTIAETLDYMSHGGEINIGSIDANELEREKPKSYIDYNAAVYAIIDSIRFQGGGDDAVNAKFDSELAGFLFAASLMVDVVLVMDKEDVVKVTNGWHSWQDQLYGVLKNSHRVSSVGIALKQPIEQSVDGRNSEVVNDEYDEDQLAA